ncbi:MAG: acylphosphatase [Candidatus Andersenbacteria bacterium]|nr:acylphosphatase [Candidatus Andersenbacteria bacterium]
MNRQHFNIRISGRVQGVSFRVAVQAQARVLGVTGFARNEADGTVYMEAEGSLGELEQLVAWCRTGTPLAQVTAVEAEKGTIRHFSDFSIAH